jgi:putative hydrolase of the HAD superfamily
VTALFDGVFSIEHTRFNPKPSMKGFMHLIKKHRLQARRCIMVEDNLSNLRTAKRLGMRTVWVDRSHRAPHFVDVNIKHVSQLPRCLHQLNPL